MIKRLKINFSKSLKATIVLSLIVVSLSSVELLTQGVYAEHSILTKSLVSGGNIVSLRDISSTANQTATVSIDQKNFRVGDDVTINVTDDAANLDPDNIDTVLVTMNSTSSNGVSAIATLSEQSINSATFSGIITLSSSTTTGNVLQTHAGDGFAINYDPEDYPESARFQAQINTAGPGTVELTDYFIDDSTKGDTACPFHPVTHAVDVDISDTTASNIIVQMSFANALGDQVITRPDLLKIGYRPSSGTGFVSLGGALDFTAKTITNVSQPSSASGQYVLGFSPGCSGGGGGGLVRPSLVVNALAGIGSFGGGADGSPPILPLGDLIKYSHLKIPLEIEQIVINHDSTIPISPMEVGLFENFDYPMTINGKGFVLGGFSNTIETQTIKTDSAAVIKFTLYETTKIQHISFYTNLRDANTQIHQSDTQVLYNDGRPIQITDPNGFFKDVAVTINEISENKKEAVFEITFAKEMDKSDIIIRSWDQNLNSRDTIILDAIEIVSEITEEAPTITYEVPIVQELESQGIPVWIKNNAAWWSDQQIGDSDFVSGIEYLIKNKIINVPGVEVGTSSTSSEIPDWIKNNAGWWADSLITDGDFIEAMQWLVANGVIQI